jgi:acetyl-CoA carboxylase carboxyl transferase subunit beta
LAWLNRDNAPLAQSTTKVDTPEGLWQRCDDCCEIFFKKDFIANQYVCPKCHHHYPIPAIERINRFVDQDSFEELDIGLSSIDPLAFEDSKKYKERLEATQKKLKRKDAFISGSAKLLGRPIQIGVFDFQFMGGSMGSVVGEKVARVFRRSLELREPAIVVSASGGARMQEGILSLMQMAKTCAVLGQLRDAGVPFVSVLTHPTTGGVAASFSMLGDVNIGEPGALIGFAGPRVIQQTIGEELPEGFQRSEYLLEHGMLDLICHRDTLRARIGQILNILYPV